MDRNALCWRGASALRLGIAALTLAAVGSAQAGIITDSSFFTSVPHTHINFETDGAGSPINLIQGQTQVMPLNAYSNLGVDFVNQVRWVNDGNPAFDAAQMIGGTPANSIPSSFVNAFAFTFNVPVQSFGFFVVNNRTASPLTIRAFDAQNNQITELVFGGVFVDGTIEIPNTTADYGFMGYAADVNIARVEVTKQMAILDDLMYSPVPTPGVLALLGAGLPVLTRRRRSR